MKKLILYLITAGLSIVVLHACGPGEEELRQQREAEEQARLDSLEQAWEMEMEEMRQDSIEQALQESLARSESAAETAVSGEEPTDAPAEIITFNEDGNYTVQVRSWRS